MITKQGFFSRYLTLSIFSYVVVLTLVERFSQFILIPELAISCSFLLVYGFDFILTSIFVFRVKIKILPLIRFLSVTIFFFGATFTLSKTYLFFVDNVSIVAVLTGFTLAPLRYMVSKNYVYNAPNSFLPALKDSIGEISRSVYTLIIILDKKKRFSKKSKYHLVNYFKSLLGFHNATLLMNLDLPWWPFSATNYIEKKVFGRDVNVFEWGSGASTVWLSRRSQHVISIEHDENWARVMALELEIRAIKNVSLQVYPAQTIDAPEVLSGKSGFSNLDFSRYARAINQFERFDLIVIDGRARVDCWVQARQHLSKGGLIVFDNYNRSRYNFELDGFKAHYFAGLTPASVWPTYTLVAEKL
jgi:hypothetical protein